MVKVGLHAGYQVQSTCCLEPRQFAGDPASLARDNILKWKDLGKYGPQEHLISRLYHLVTHYNID